MKENDDRVFKDSTHTIIHRILNKMRLCEKYNIDYDVYLNRMDLVEVDEILNCCLKNKDSKYIARRE